MESFIKVMRCIQWFTEKRKIAYNFLFQFGFFFSSTRNISAIADIVDLKSKEGWGRMSWIVFYLAIHTRQLPVSQIKASDCTLYRCKWLKGIFQGWFSCHILDVYFQMRWIALEKCLFLLIAYKGSLGQPTWIIGKHNKNVQESIWE